MRIVGVRRPTRFRQLLMHSVKTRNVNRVDAPCPGKIAGAASNDEQRFRNPFFFPLCLGPGICQLFGPKNMKNVPSTIRSAIRAGQIFILMAKTAGAFDCLARGKPTQMRVVKSRAMIFGDSSAWFAIFSRRDFLQNRFEKCNRLQMQRGGGRPEI